MLHVRVVSPTAVTGQLAGTLGYRCWRPERGGAGGGCPPAGRRRGPVRCARRGGQSGAGGATVKAAGDAHRNPGPWARYRNGPWPARRGQIFDFTTTPSGYNWPDDLARDAANVLAQAAGPQVAGHSDWYCGNLRFRDDEVVAAYEWDSLITDSEAVIAGLSAGCYTVDSIDGPEAPAPERS